MQSKTSYTTYSAGLIILMLALSLFLGFIKALILAEFIIAIAFLIPSVFFGILVQYIFVTILFEEDKLIVKRPLLFWNIWPSRKYKMISIDINEILYVRFSNTMKGAFTFAIIDKSDNFRYRIEASSYDYFFLKEEFEKRNIVIKNYSYGHQGLASDTQNWRRRKASDYKS
jgi:hypothetical protein